MQLLPRPPRPQRRLSAHVQGSRCQGGHFHRFPQHGKPRFHPVWGSLGPPRLAGKTRCHQYPAHGRIPRRAAHKTRCGKRESRKSEEGRSQTLNGSISLGRFRRSSSENCWREALGPIPIVRLLRNLSINYFESINQSRQVSGTSDASKTRSVLLMEGLSMVFRQNLLLRSERFWVQTVRAPTLRAIRCEGWKRCQVWQWDARCPRCSSTLPVRGTRPSRRTLPFRRASPHQSGDEKTPGEPC